ncbi:hypothetical protein OG280_04115 [Streptomyces virginiae]|uniref:hypothetical protein n=1 Tax=Streptomyces virginiae TaxID=1961 RepID=UPI00324B75EF
MGEGDEMRYARFDSVEGLLQRGRGLGAVRAVQDPHVAAPFVHDAIRRDWRWDGFDERSRYLAGLVRDLRLSPAPVVELLSGDERQCGRAVDVLELLALEGGDEAREALRSHVREGGALGTRTGVGRRALACGVVGGPGRGRAATDRW